MLGGGGVVVRAAYRLLAGSSSGAERWVRMDWKLEEFGRRDRRVSTIFGRMAP